MPWQWIHNFLWLPLCLVWHRIGILFRLFSCLMRPFHTPDSRFVLPVSITWSDRLFVHTFSNRSHWIRINGLNLLRWTFKNAENFARTYVFPGRFPWQMPCPPMKSLSFVNWFSGWINAHPRCVCAYLCGDVDQYSLSKPFYKISQFDEAYCEILCLFRNECAITESSPKNRMVSFCDTEWFIFQKCSSEFHTDWR